MPIKVGRRSDIIPGDQINKISILDSFFHPIAFSFDQYGFSVMQQPIQDSGGQRAVVVEDFGPVLEGSVGGDHQGTTLITHADHLEQ